MSSAFQHTRGGVAVRFDAAEAALLRKLFGELVELLDDGAGDADDDPLTSAVGTFEPRSTPDDPAVARLFPDAYRDDEEAASDFRRYTESDLRSGKIDAARVAAESLGDGGRLVLTAEQAQTWLTALNDLRLTLGTRLSVTEDHEQVFGALPDDDPRKQLWYVYDWLSYLQQSLVEALAHDL
ncbi:MAG: DUF2017 domain-containing protein [Streptosporangiales bacterium]|nr:DUF2017 domain-containing protein [Streptosporangiales bacterium]MBO0892063.1 DUF2017 domain-containing protein [Acidothermales bacterium]